MDNAAKNIKGTSEKRHGNAQKQSFKQNEERD